MYFKNNQNVGNLLLFVVSHVVVKMAESFATNTVSRFRSPKTGEEESKLLQRSIPKSTAYKTKWAIKIFHEWQINRKVKGPVLDAGGAFKDFWRFVQSSVVVYRFGKYGCQRFKLLAE